jgi:hypothetical protein
VPRRTYPWYAKVRGGTLEQGDLLDDCPVFLPPDDLAQINPGLAPPTEARLQWVLDNVVVMSQTCDLVEGREKVLTVGLCAVMKRSELDAHHPCANKGGMEHARRGNLPGFHVLSECSLTGLEREVMIVDFRQIYTLPVPFLRKRAAGSGPRIRLLPPYREHLAQGFARFFMRVGLPVDIPPFR